MHTRRLWHSIFLYVIYPARERSYICINVYPSSSRCLSLSNCFFLLLSHFRTAPPFLFYVRYIYISSSVDISPSPPPSVRLALSLFPPAPARAPPPPASFSLSLTLILLSLIPMYDGLTRDSSLDLYTLCSVSLLYVTLSKSVTSTHTNVHTRCHLRFFILYIYIYIHATVCLPVYTR